VVTSQGDILEEEGSWLTAEFNYGTVHALIEYKDRRCVRRPGDLARLLTDWKTRAVKTLAERAAVPFFLVLYTEPAWFVVIPVGHLAHERLGCPYRVYSVAAYDSFLQHIRASIEPEVDLD
jgi:hypothetical protein